MKLMLTKLTALLLVCLMLGSMLASCVEPEIPTDTGTETGSETEGTENGTNGGDETDGGDDTDGTGTDEGNDSEAGSDEDSSAGESSESENGSDENTETDTDTDTETETETETYETIPGIDYSPIEFEERPDCVVTETVLRDTLEPFDMLIEGEDYFSSTLQNIKTSSYPGRSGGSVLYSVYTPDEWNKDNPADVEWNKPLTVTYKVNIPFGGYYKIKTNAGDIGRKWTSNFSLVIDNKKTLVAKEGKVAEEVKVSDGLGDILQIVDHGAVYLSAGEHKFQFVVDLEDALFNDRDPGWPYGRVSFLLDYFTIQRAYSDNDAPVVSYGANISNDANADILSEAAKVNVLDGRYPITVDYVHFFDEAGTGNYTITDFYGNVIARRYFNGEKNDVVKVKINIENHPLGYFKLLAGDYVAYYVVTPSFADRTLTDSPFAMDFASGMLIKQYDYLKPYSAAMRMAGVTWVRERMSWGSYQTDYKDGVPTYNEAYLDSMADWFGQISSTGMNILAMISSSPAWTRDIANDYSDDVSITWQNYQGFYGSQLAIYDAAKRIATKLNGIVDVLEFHNETDHKSRDIAEMYSSWFKAAALGTIDSGADVKISFAGLCRAPSDRDYTPLLMSSNVMKYTSVFNYHSHTALPGSNTVTDYLQSSTLTSAFTGVTTFYDITTPIWISESGMKLPSETPTDTHKTKQVPYIVSSTVQSLALGTDKHFWFVAAPYLEAGGDFGSFAPSHQPYPIIAAEAVMTHVLGEAKYIGELNGLAENARGYLFNTGKRVAAVLWTNKQKAKYTIETDHPVVMTDVMGKETYLEPVGGKITVDLSTNPIYITYSTPPTDYLKHSYEIVTEKMPEVTFGDRVVLTPEFADYTFDVDTKDLGHNIKDGTVINVRVCNYNNVAVTGKVNVSIPGFTVLGLDTEVTVEPCSEKFIQLTLQKTSDVAFDDHVIFTGTFNGEACSPTAVRVYTEKDETEFAYSFGNTLRIDKKTDASCLEELIINVENFDGEIVIKVNEQNHEKFTFENGTMKIDLSDIEVGKHTLVIGFVSEAGCLEDSIYLTLRYDGQYVVFRKSR